MIHYRYYLYEKYYLHQKCNLDLMYVHVIFIIILFKTYHPCSPFSFFSSTFSSTNSGPTTHQKLEHNHFTRLMSFQCKLYNTYQSIYVQRVFDYSTEFNPNLLSQFITLLDRWMASYRLVKQSTHYHLLCRCNSMQLVQHKSRHKICYHAVDVQQLSFQRQRATDKRGR